MDRFDVHIRLRICIRIQVLACNVLVHYGVSSGECMDQNCISACIMELAGMELAYTHLEFHIAIVLAMVAEWEDVGVFIVQTVSPMPPREVY